MVERSMSLFGEEVVSRIRHVPDGDAARAQLAGSPALQLA
jgi:hypothetical protein